MSKVIKIMVVMHVCTSMQSSALIQKKVDLYFESKDPHAQLKMEPVEWPVKLVYADTFYGKMLRKCADWFGHYITYQQARSKNNADQKVVQKQIDHYLTFYKDLINMDQFEVPQDGFNTFNDWFIRKLKNPEQDRPLDNDALAICSPSDCKLLILPDIALHSMVTIKEQRFNIAQFLGNEELAKKYENGVMMIFRLAPYDYHRYHFPFDCRVGPEQFIAGKYHSVNPRAFMCGVQPLTRNKRTYELLYSQNVDQSEPVVMAQVGATAVASIVNHFMDYSPKKPKLKYGPKKIFEKGQEMGYFQFGGSTLVLLFAPNTIESDSQIVQNSLNGYETAVKARETVAHWL
jgi:phosphatidylserine decarboxylase